MLCPVVMHCLAVCALRLFLQPPPLVACPLGLAGCSWGQCHQGDQQGSGDISLEMPESQPKQMLSQDTALGPTPCMVHFLQNEK